MRRTRHVARMGKGKGKSYKAHPKTGHEGPEDE